MRSTNQAQNGGEVGGGRLTLEAFSERVGLAQTARTDQELARLAHDLPGNLAVAGAPAVEVLVRGGGRFTALG